MSAVRCTAVCAIALAGLASGAATAATRLAGFRSPSGNIACLLVPGPPGTLLCTLRHADYAAALQSRCMGPDGSGVDWHGFALTATGKGAVNCSGGILFSPGTQRPSYVTLPYGSTWRRGAFACSSRTTGVTCRTPAGHGLFVSRQRWRSW